MPVSDEDVGRLAEALADCPDDLEELERLAREECARRGIDPDELCADGGVEAWMVVLQQMKR